LSTGRSETLHHGGVGLAPTQAPIDKSAIMHSALARAAEGTNITPYEELIAMGVSASDAAPFKNMGGTAGSGQTSMSPNGA
jgi:hypothetical protein